MTKVRPNNYLFSNKALAGLIVPLIIEQFLSILVGMADSVMIANVGEAAVSGVSLVDQIMILMINVFAALATGGAVVVGQYLGQRHKEEAGRASTQLCWFITIIAIGVTIAIYLCKYPILHGVFGQIDDEVRRHANVYLMIVTSSIPFIALYNAGAAIFRSMGNSRVTMQVSMLMNAINVAGNAILIYGFKMEAEGVAIPTLVSRMVASFVIIALLLKKSGKKGANGARNEAKNETGSANVIQLERTFRYKPDWFLIKKMLSIGIPNGLENSMFQLGKIIVISLVSSFGTFAIAANAVCNVLAIFQILPGIAMGMAITTVVSRCVGAGDYEQVKHYNKKLIIVSHICMLITVGAILLALPFIIRIYNLSEQTGVLVRRIIELHSIGALVLWPLAFNLPATFRASGDARACMIIAIVSMWVFRVGLSFILAKYFGLGVYGVWIAMMSDWAFRLICFVIRYFGGRWKQQALV